LGEFETGNKTLCRQSHHMTYRAELQNQSTGATSECHEETKKERQTKKSYSGANWLFAKSSHVVGSICNLVLWDVGGLRAVVTSFKFHQNWLSGL